jgi:cytoskeletal protein CcmA (bactofilin family)
MFFKKEIEPTLNTSSEMILAKNLPLSEEISEVIQIAPTLPEEQNIRQAGNLVVGEGVRLRGSFNVPNKTTVTGLIEGRLATKELLVGQEGKVQGEINCQLADIAGHVENDLQVHIALTIRASAVITGNIFYQEITIEKGAKISGQLAKL